MQNYLIYILSNGGQRLTQFCNSFQLLPRLASSVCPTVNQVAEVLQAIEYIQHDAHKPAAYCS